MATTINVAGLATIKLDTAALRALEILGYTVNGAQVRIESFWEDVHGDENGGEAGPPINSQFHGAVAHIHLELSKWDVAVADKVCALLAGATVGVPPAAGTLLIADGGTKNTYRVCIASPTAPMNFPNCIPRGAIEINKGTRFSRLVLDFTAYSLYVAGQGNVLMNTTVSG